uniref:acyl carrier protein phosphodiesterase n=1 Tax=Poriferisphaera corsica TaxID=2528020 RepID=UPI0019093B57|nr:acyl carrier protein phosphodiesterase [Poriferisphaera corsica]
MPDLIRGKLPTNLDPQIMHGVHTHRCVDAFTDTHPLFAQSKTPFLEIPNHPHFAGILIDIFYDHFLSIDWQHYHTQSLPAFITNAYSVLNAGKHLMPTQMLERITAIHHHDYLSKYATINGLTLVLSRMSSHFSQRLNRNVKLQTAIPILLANYSSIRNDFNAFYPQLMKYVTQTNLQSKNRADRSQLCTNN